MNRLELGLAKGKELYAVTDEQMASHFAPDPEFFDILNSFIYGEVFRRGNLTDKQRELMALVVATAYQTLSILRLHVEVSLRIGVTPVEIKEAVYQCAPFIGFAKTLVALDEVNAVFKKNGISLPVQGQKQVTEDDRYEMGVKLQEAVFHENALKMVESAPEDFRHVHRYLTGVCFGDIYTRSGLDLKTRLLLSICILCALGAPLGSLKSFIQGNLNVGNDRELMISAITNIIPHVGFPNATNALMCLNEIVPKK